MRRQLNVRSDEAYRIAHDIADRLNISTTEVVVKALHDYGARVAPSVEGMTPTQRSEYKALMSLARRTGKAKKPGATSDHRDLYDDFGLPR
ncbi:MAG: type II toxin-antitoxin system VapB family antitoxin [Xanthobacteraceae bacterium]